MGSPNNKVPKLNEFSALICEYWSPFHFGCLLGVEDFDDVGKTGFANRACFVVCGFYFLSARQTKELVSAWNNHSLLLASQADPTAVLFKSFVAHFEFF